MPDRMMEGWGRYPRYPSAVLTCATPGAVDAAARSVPGLVARGNGRSYGDAAIGQAATLLCRGLDRMIAFDPATRLLRVEAGTLLSEVIAAFLPRGYFPPVVPGTRFVTIGGMIACDVHGKNHHRAGGFGDHLHAFRLLLPGGETVSCSRDENPELFRATIGGMGLTGVITEATFALNPVETGWIVQRTTVAGNLAEAIAALEAADDATYTVAWIDCVSRGPGLGRALIYAGEHATRKDLEAATPNAPPFPGARGARIGLPVDMPGWLLNRASVSAFNQAYFHAGARKADKPQIVHWEPYFFPLDGIGAWNRLYGRRGFLQHQCVIPTGPALSVLGEIIDRFARSGKGSFLAVLKKLGPASGLLSFPMPGYTLALDLPASQDVFAMLDEIDRAVVEAGGRLYMAKDARQSRLTLEAGYQHLGEFRDLRKATGAADRFQSRLSTRLGL